MPFPATPPNCPICGKVLTLLPDSEYHTAPWLCATCRRGWWPLELAARRLFNVRMRSFPADHAARIVADVEAAKPLVDQDRVEERNRRAP